MMYFYVFRCITGIGSFVRRAQINDAAAMVASFFHRRDLWPLTNTIS